MQFRQFFRLIKNPMNIVDDLITKISAELIQNRRYNYSEQILDEYLKQNPERSCFQNFIKNKRGQSLSILTIKKNSRIDKTNKENILNHHRHENQTETCIIYAHGLGSNKLEALNLVQNIPVSFNFDICSFDFSGSGKSEGQFTTYGKRQQDDINAVLAWLDSRRVYRKYVLWGRSMGATAIVLSQGKNPHPKIQCIVLDSPFFSFQKAAVEIASRNSVLPQIMLGYMMQPLKTYMEKHQPANNPFSIKLQKQISNIHSRILLIYSKNDNIVSYLHSKQIGRCSNKSPVELEIEQNHNKPRTRQTYLKAVDFILKHIQINDMKKKRSSSKRRVRGISISSKEQSEEKLNPKKISNSKKYENELALKLRSTSTMNTVSVGYSNSVITDSQKSSNNSIKWSSKSNMIKSVLYDKPDPVINTFRISEIDYPIQTNHQINNNNSYCRGPF